MPLDSAIISSHSFYDSMCHRRRDGRYRSGRREWIKVKNRAHPSRLDRDGRTKTINKRYGIVTKSEPEMPMNTPSRRTLLANAPAVAVAALAGGAARVARGFAKAGVEFNREEVAKLIRKELQELRRMPYLSDISRETADKAERLFTFINSRFLGCNPQVELLRSGQIG
jgi:hypothetical protein